MAESSSEHRFFPVGIDLSGRHCVVVGGGRIGTRKAETLAHAGAHVTVVSPAVTGALRESIASGLIDWVEAPFREEHVRDAFLVVAAADDERVNAAVVESAARAGALVCDASSADRSQFIFGAQLRREDTTIAVFTDGRDPGHARRTRDGIAAFLDADAARRSHDCEAAGCAGDGQTTRPRAASRPAPRAVEPAHFVMIGASLAGGLEAGHGPPIRHSDAKAFAQARKSHKALRAFLDWVRENTMVLEAFVWNTCQRIEFYGWVPAALDETGRQRLATRIRHALYRDEPGQLEVNVLEEDAARHHLLRTACGLNSDLPGDRDVVAQLQTALRLAECAGTAGARAASLVEETVRVADAVTRHTAWDRFAAGYCEAALGRVFEADDVRPDELRHVVIGGSTTSRSVLSALIRRHGVPERRLTVVYRDHHGQMKQMRKAVGNGKRIRVHDYSDRRVLRAIAAADYVFFGIDQPEPVIDAAALGSRERGCPLTVVDFNTSGSVAGAGEDGPVRLWSAADLDHAVAAHVAITTSRSGFSRAVEEAEAFIEQHLAVQAPAPGSGEGRGAEI